MATDNTHLPHSEDLAASTNQEFNPDIVQVAQADAGAGANTAQPTAQPAPIPGVPNGEVQVQIPAGQTVVRVQIAPGETIDLPFDGALAAKFGEQGNLAVKVGDQTIILLGYAEANQQEGVTLKDAKGHAVDVATVIAQTDPSLDIQTAAGPAAGTASQGGHLFLDFNPGNGLGGFNELNVINATELRYGLIQPDETILPVGDTHASLVSITFDANNGVVNEDDLGHHTHVEEGRVPELAQAADEGVSHSSAEQLLEQLSEQNPGGETTWTLANHGSGNDPFDQNDHEGGSQTDGSVAPGDDGQGAFNDSGNPSGLDQDREPTTAKAVVKVDFHGDVPGTVTFSNGGNVPVITQLSEMGLTSHGQALSYALLPAADGHGETVVAYYVQDGVSNVVFTIGIEENSGATSQSDFHIDYTIYGPIDNGGSAADILNINVPFYMTDSDGPAVASPADALTFSVVDDVPELGHIHYGTQDGHTNVAEGVVHADLTIGHDESAGTQHTSYQGADGQTHHADDVNGKHVDHVEHQIENTLSHILSQAPDAGNALLTYQQGVLNNIDPSFTEGGHFCGKALGSAQTQLDVSFGADGKADATDTQSGQTLFANDGAANAQAFELYMQGAGATGKPDSGNALDAAQDHEKTTLTIDVDGKDVPVDAYQLDANTIIGIGEDGTPAFTLHLDPQSGELTLTQYHQMQNADGSDANDATHLLGLNPDGSTYDLVHFRATDYDGDHADGTLDVSFIDDAPKVTCNHVGGTVEESALHGGNRDHKSDTTVAHGSLASTVDFGADKDGKFAINGSHDALAHLAAQNHDLRSGGHDVHFEADGNTLTGFIYDHGHKETVFTLTVDSDGHYKFELGRPLDEHHQGEDSTTIDFSGIITATDGDKDQVTLDNGQFTVKVVDDMPEVTCNRVGGTVEESALSGGNEDSRHDTTVAQGSLASTVSFGADGAGKFGFAINGSDAALTHLAAQNHGLSSGGHDVYFEADGHTLTGFIYDHGHKETVFTLSVDSDGHYKFELDKPLDEHKQGEDSISIDFSGVITATDGDKDQVTLNNGQFVIHVTDDQPTSTICVADHGGVTIDESAGRQADDQAGQVPSTFKDVHNHGDAMGWAQSSSSIVNTTVHFGADGKGSESLSLNLPHNGVDSGLTTTDGHHIYLYKEGDLVVGREGDSKGNAAFALSIESNGKLTVVQYEPIHQGNANNPDDSVHIDDKALQVTYTVTDGDGDNDSHTVNVGDAINFKDDGPSKFSIAFNHGYHTVDESALKGGHGDDVTFSIDYQNNGGVGADGLKSVTFTLNNHDLHTASGEVVHTQMVNGVLIGYTGNDSHANHVFTITDNHNGSYTFELDQPLRNGGSENDQIKLDLTATVTDGDGDKQSSDFSVNVNDDTPGTPCVVSHDPNFILGEGRIDEDALPTGNHDSDTAPFNNFDDLNVLGHFDGPGGTTVAGSITVDYGEDGRSGLSLTTLKVTSDVLLGNNTLLNISIDANGHISGTNNLTSGDKPLDLSFDGHTLTGSVAGQAVFTFTLDDQGHWSYQLLQSLDHPIDNIPSFFGIGGDSRPEDNLHFSFGVTATDKDGDANTGYVNINVDDDGPKAGDVTLGQVQENSGQHDLGSVGDVFGDHYSAGADGLGSIKITDGNGEGHGTLTIDSQGHVWYTPPANVTGDKSYSFEYTVTDKDGDSSTGKITVGVKDNHIPTITHEDPQSHQPAVGPGEVSVDESHLATGTHAQPGGETVHGAFTVDGGDESVTIKIGDQEIKIDGTGNEVIADKDGLGELHVTGVTNNGDGTYTVNYDYTLDHAKHNDANSDLYDTSFKVTVTDHSGDTTDGDLTVHVADDKPHFDVASIIQTATIDETKGTSTGSLPGVFDDVRDPQDALGWTSQQIISVGLNDLYSSYGADGPGQTPSVILQVPAQGTDSGLTTTDGHKIFLYQNDDGTVVGRIADDQGHANPNGEPAFAISISTGYILSVIQYEPLHHADGTNPDDGVQLAVGSLTAEVIFTDGDGDQSVSNVNFSHNITFKDDGPTATDLDTTTHVHEGDASQVVGHVTFDAGADGLQSIDVNKGNGGSQGTLSIDPDGTVHYTAPHDVTGNQDYTFEYTVTDKDGDAVTKSITVHVDDGKPTLDLGITDGVVDVDEGGLTTGTHPDAGHLNADGELVSPTNTFTIDTHGEGIKSLEITMPDGGAKFDALTYIQYGGVSFEEAGGNRLVIDSIVDDGTGKYTVAYHYILAQAVTGETDPGEYVKTFGVTVTDNSGDTAQSQITVHIKDDAPIAMDDGFNTVTAQTTHGQNIGNVLTNDKAGADGYASQKISSVDGGVSDGHGGFTITNDKGTIHVAADGTVTFDSNTGHNYGSGETLGFDYTIQDKDGDTSTAHASFDVGNPSIPTAPQASDLSVNESQLDGGTHQGDGSTTAHNTFTLPDGFTVDPSDLGEHTLSNGKLTISMSGQTVTYSYELTSPVNDGTTGSSDGQNVVNDAESYTVHLTGPNGQSLDVPVHVDVKDDVPTAQHADLGSVDEGTSNNIGHVDFNAGADGLHSVEVTSGNDGSQGTLTIDSDGKVHYTPPADVNGAHDYTFAYEVTDKDGDKANNTITVHVDDTAKPVLVVGDNVDDNASQQKDHYIDHAPSDQNQGEINGGDAGDVLVGDTGGKSGQVAPGNYNICIILDNSLSMTQGSSATVPDSGGKDRLEVMQEAVDALLAKYANHNGDVNVEIISFDTTYHYIWNGTSFKLADLDNAQDAVNDLKGNVAGTNYEAAMQAAKTWFDGISDNGYTNKAYFLSDGDPTYRMSGNHNDQPTESGNTSQYINEAVDAAGNMLTTGNDGLNVEFQAIGIGKDIDPTNLNHFDNQTGDDKGAQIINSADDLNAALDVGKAPEPYAQGNDVINGGKGNDLIFGDQVYTESHDDGNPNTIGWQNFGNMTEAEIAAWLTAHPDEAGKEYAGVQYGNDTLNGGDGNDSIYGQGGDDIITGGTGTDKLNGGSGNDTYVWKVGDGNDTIIETAGLKDTLEIQNSDTLPTLVKSGENLIITVGNEQITVQGQFHADSDGDANTNSAVEYIKVGGQLYQVELQGGTPILVAVNTAPVNTVPSSLVAVGSTTFNLGVTDADTQILTVTLAVDHGAITLASMAGLTFDHGDGNNDGTMTFSGTQDAINAAMSGLHYIPDSNGDNAQLTMTSNDHDGHTTTSTVPITTIDSDVLNLSSSHSTYSGSNTETLSHNSDFSNGQTTYNDNGSAHHISDTTNGGHTINGGGGNDWIEGGKGDDTLSGGDGNDYLDGGVGHNKFDGGAGDDVIKVTHDDLTGSQSIHGGAGNDLLDLSAVGTWDFTGAGHNGIDGIEKFDLGSGNNNKATITLDAASVLDISDTNHTLVISGDGGDKVNLKDDSTNSWTKMDSVTNSGHTYDVYHSGSGATVLVDDHVQTQIIHNS